MHYGPRRSCMTGLPRSAVFPFDMSLEKYIEIFYICMKKKALRFAANLAFR